MSLEKKINDDLKKAMKDKDQGKISVLRMIRADIQSLSIEKKRNELNDEDIIKLVHRQAKRHKESIEQFTKGGRNDLVEKEKAELKIIELYIPEQLSEEELRKIVSEAISETGASSKADMGKVMKFVLEKAKGRADGKTVSGIVASLLK